MIGFISPDFKSLQVTIYEDVGEPKKVLLFERQGFEWEFTGRMPPKSVYLTSIKELQGRINASFKPFCNTRFPKMIVPFVSGDVSCGFFGIENFDMLRGGVESALPAGSEVKRWLEDFGAIFGDAMYVGRERTTLKEIDAYVMGWNSNHEGLVREILRGCLHVLQGCKMIEVLSITQDYKIKSLAVQTPSSVPVAGRLLRISKIKIIKQRRKKTGPGVIEEHADADPNAAVAALDAPVAGGGVGGDEDAVAAHAGQSNTSLAEDDEPEKEDLQVQPVKVYYVCGIKYDDLEQTFRLRPAKEKFDYYKRAQYEMFDINVLITSDRNLQVSVYEVTEDLSVVAVS